MTSQSVTTRWFMPISPTIPVAVNLPTKSVRASVDKTTWIVVAAYNEADCLGATLQSLCQHYENVVVVDDGSRDATHSLALHYPAWVLKHVINCGQGAALQTGIDFALSHGAEIIVTFDADGQHAVEDICIVTKPIQKGEADVVLGSRFLGRTIDMPRSRWFVLKLAVLFTRVVSRIRVTDTHNGLRAFSQLAARKIRIRQNRMAHASEIIDQIRFHHLRYCEAPTTVRYTVTSIDKGQANSQAFKIAAQFLLGRFVK